MTNAKISVCTNGKVRKFKDLPLGSIFRAYANGNFVRFIKAEQDDGDVLVAIGPFSDEGRPYYFDKAAFEFHDDTLCLDETGTITLRPTEPCKEGAFRQHGNLLVTESDAYLLFDMGASSNQKFFLSLGTGEIVQRMSSSKYIAFDSYVLTRPTRDDEIAFKWSRPASDTSRAA